MQHTSDYGTPKNLGLGHMILVYGLLTYDSNKLLLYYTPLSPISFIRLGEIQLIILGFGPPVATY